jgi:tetratricopeptide (TPR) repeat protein
VSRTEGVRDSSSDLADTLAHARALFARGEREAALEALDQALAARPDHLPTLMLKGTLLLEARQEEAALSVHRQAAAAWPRSSEALCGLARCLHLLGRNEEGLALAEEACRLLGEADNFRQAGPVYLTLVWCLRDLRRLDEALRVAEIGLGRTADALLAEWASVLEEELAAAERERC